MKMIKKGEPPINCNKEQWNAIKVWCNECVEQAKAEERKKFIEIAEKTAEMLIRSCKNPKEAEFTKTVVGNIIYQIEELERKEKDDGNKRNL